jgi:hypothetical protein
MATQPQTVHVFPSTTWKWTRVKIQPAPEAPAGTARRRRTIMPLTWRNPRKPLTIMVTYRGGGEAWWQLEGRGRCIRIEGSHSLHDALWLFAGDESALPPA